MIFFAFRWIKRLIVLSVVLVLLGLLGILFLPKSYRIEKEIAVKSSPDKVFVATREIARGSVSQLDRLSKEFHYQNSNWLNRFVGVDQLFKTGVQCNMKEEFPIRMEVTIAAREQVEFVTEYQFEKAGDWTIVKVIQEKSFHGVYGGIQAFVLKNMWEHLQDRYLQELKRVGETN